jgi:hypothetical protein
MFQKIISPTENGIGSPYLPGPGIDTNQPGGELKSGEVLGRVRTPQHTTDELEYVHL